MKRILVCACLALVLAGCCRRQTGGCGAARVVTVAQLAQAPAAMRGRCVTVSGRLRNAGGNYFTELRLELADAAGAAVAVKPWLPLELPPPRPGATGRRPAVLSDYLGKNLRVTARVTKADAAYLLEVQQAEIIEENQP